MADKKVSDETAAAALSGDELWHGAQDGADVKVSANQLLDYVFGEQGKWALISANPNSTTWTQIGCGAPTGYGTAAAATPANTNYRTRRHRVTYTSATTADAQAGIRGFAHAYRVDGFHFVARFGLSTLPTNPRLFVGLASTSGALTAGDPSAIVTTVYFGADAGQATFRLMANDPSGAATQQADTAIAIAADGYYEARLWCEAGGTTVHARLKRLDTGNEAEWNGEATADLPQTTAALHPHVVGALNGTNTGTAIVVEPSMIYLRTAA